MVVQNYRGISLSSCLAKFFNNLILKMLTCFENELTSCPPNGIQTKDKSNCSVLETFIDKSLKKMIDYSCFIDFSKAFDTVWRKGLLAKIESYGINGKNTQYIEKVILKYHCTC